MNPAFTILVMFALIWIWITLIPAFKAIGTFILSIFESIEKAMSDEDEK